MFDIEAVKSWLNSKKASRKGDKPQWFAKKLKEFRFACLSAFARACFILSHLHCGMYAISMFGIKAMIDVRSKLQNDRSVKARGVGVCAIYHTKWRCNLSPRLLV